MNRNKLWNKKEKMRVVRRVLNTGDSLSTIAKEENLDVKLIIEWTRKYNEYGQKSLVSPSKKVLGIEKMLGWELENLSSKKIYLEKGVGQSIILQFLRG
jgi:transposase-like protein